MNSHKNKKEQKREKTPINIISQVILVGGQNENAEQTDTKTNLLNGEQFHNNSMKQSSQNLLPKPLDHFFKDDASILDEKDDDSFYSHGNIQNWLANFELVKTDLMNSYATGTTSKAIPKISNSFNNNGSDLGTNYIQKLQTSEQLSTRQEPTDLLGQTAVKQFHSNFIEQTSQKLLPKRVGHFFTDSWILDEKDDSFYSHGNIQNWLANFENEKTDVMSSNATGESSQAIQKTSNPSNNKEIDLGTEYIQKLQKSKQLSQNMENIKVESEDNKKETDLDVENNRESLVKNSIEELENHYLLLSYYYKYLFDGDVVKFRNETAQDRIAANYEKAVTIVETAAEISLSVKNISSDCFDVKSIKRSADEDVEGQQHISKRCKKSKRKDNKKPLLVKYIKSGIKQKINLKRKVSLEMKGAKKRRTPSTESTLSNAPQEKKKSFERKTTGRVYKITRKQPPVVVNFSPRRERNCQCSSVDKINISLPACLLEEYPRRACQFSDWPKNIIVTKAGLVVEEAIESRVPRRVRKRSMYNNCI